MYKESMKEIENVISNYFKGIFFGDVTKLKACFHESLTIYGDIKGVEYLKSAKEYLGGVKNRRNPKDLNEPFKMKIIGIDIMGKIAIAKLHVPMLGYNYYDYLSLAKVNNGWKIVNKLFTHEE